MKTISLFLLAASALGVSLNSPWHEPGQPIVDHDEHVRPEEPEHNPKDSEIPLDDQDRNHGGDNHHGPNGEVPYEPYSGPDHHEIPEPLP